jgi:hypothetical protein
MKRKFSTSLPVLVIIFLMAGCIGPIKDVDYHPSSMITIRDSLTTIRFTLYPGDKPVKPKKGKNYYWYGTNRIHTTTDDYSGRLLDGTFMIFNETGGLLEKGTFDDGLKTGNWVTWGATGEVNTCIKYRNGFARDTIQKNLIKNIPSGKNDTTGVELPKEKEKKAKKKEKREKENAGKKK